MKPELLAPVQDFTSLRAAISSGADAVYFGIKELNMRINAKNFNLKDLKKINEICKLKKYLALNSIIYDNEVNKVKEILKKSKKYIDAVICWDYAVVKECEKLGIPIHLSTQASVSNIESLLFLKNKIKNLKRMVLARELSLDQIKNIIYNLKNKKIKLEIETFIHGAMCVSLSGRCFLSQFSFNKSANRGDCLQPCRRGYRIHDVENEVEYELGNNYVMSPKDLCTMPFIDKLIEAGIDSFKIEGRNRSPEYVKMVAGCYREIIDYYFDLKLKKINKKIFEKLLKNKKNQLIKKLKTVYNRGFSSGFFLGKPIDEWTNEYGSKATHKKIYLGYIKNFYNKINVAEIKLETNDLKINDNIMIQGPTTGVVEDSITSMEINNKKINKAKKGQKVGIKLNSKARVNDKIYLWR